MNKLRNPYHIIGPALISFSGGRSSGYMLRHILDTHGGTLPDDVHVCFMNTGKERPQSLEFVAECGERWGVKINWLEYDQTAENNTRVVDFATASRNGEPFEALIRKKNYLPNPVTRFCTIELKIRPSKHFMLRQGIKHWDNIIGFRADEPRRVAKMRAGNAAGKESWQSSAPMGEAGVTRRDVVAWWEGQPFDLRLPSVSDATPAGNCDLCFLKGQYTLLQLLRERPEWADWWIEMEALALASKPRGAVFRIDRGDYARQRDLAVMSDPLPFADDEAIPCFCGD